MWLCMEGPFDQGQVAPPIALQFPPGGATELIHQTLQSVDELFVPIAPNQSNVVWGVQIVVCPQCSKRLRVPNCAHWQLATMDMTRRVRLWRTSPAHRESINVWLQLVLEGAHVDLDVPLMALRVLPVA